jgi:hypothetical protein
VRLVGDFFAETRRKLEELPSDSGRAVDVLAGANLRLFARLAQLEGAYRDLRTRLAIVEADIKRSKPVMRVEPRLTQSGKIDTRGGNAAIAHALRKHRAQGPSPTARSPATTEEPPATTAPLAAAKVGQ